MQIAVKAGDRQWEELITCSDKIDWVRVLDESFFSSNTSAVAFIDLTGSGIHPVYSTFKVPVFINAVSTTLHSSGAAANIFRINGWPGFLRRDTWEIAGKLNEQTTKIFSRLNKELVSTADEPGLISARVIAMIINEAFFALEDGVSSRQEIDTAMKSGTNYPYGPFEWGEIIGFEDIYQLLQVLALRDKRYQPAQLLAMEALKGKK